MRVGRRGISLAGMLAATRMVAVGALAALVGAAPAPAAEVRATLGGVDVAAWTPEGGDETTRWPVVVFSHALGLCPAQARFLTTALAAAGYLVVAPYHADSACELSVNVADPARMALKPANLWTDADYRNRAEDVVRALGALSAGAEPGWRADATRVALVGHSLGGYTMLGLAGAWPSWPTPAGVRAVIAFSPYALPLLANGAIERLVVPVMFQTGTQDMAFALPLTLGAGAYARAPAPKTLVEIEYGTHLAWTDAGVFRRDAILATTLAFLDHHVRGLPERAELLAAGGGVSLLLRDPPSHLPAVTQPSFAAQTVATVREWWQRSRDLWPF